jgi:hypothetical protein
MEQNNKNKIKEKQLYTSQEKYNDKQNKCLTLLANN